MRGYSGSQGRRYPQVLTDTAVRNAKPREKPYKLSDSGALYVLKTWTCCQRSAPCNRDCRGRLIIPCTSLTFDGGVAAVSHLGCSRLQARRAAFADFRISA